ncbi:hypothetical protein CVS40_9858 [Lucilia cuprina]|nr:hypothetical protein CVS40_9858 [Lucilia cuprina]
MGVVWFLEILSYLLEMIIGPNIFIIIPDMFNALHGLFTFISIVFNSRIYNCIRKRCLPKRYSMQTEMPTRTFDSNAST